MTTNPLRLLIVDDDEVLRESLAHRYRRHGCDVCEAGTVAEALALADATQLDIAILDLHLPDGTGMDVLTGSM